MKVTFSLQQRLKATEDLNLEEKVILKYFVRNIERDGTCYHEFYKGKWDEKTFWKDDSLFLHDDVMFKNQGFVDAVIDVIPTYDPFGETEITHEIWKKIGQVIKEKDEKSKELYQEADVWVNDVFKEYECITILGI